MRALAGRHLATTSENKHYADFGCSYQNNLAAQIANPADLLGPRKLSEVDAENRSAVIDTYRSQRHFARVPGQFGSRLTDEREPREAR